MAAAMFTTTHQRTPFGGAKCLSRSHNAVNRVVYCSATSSGLERAAARPAGAVSSSSNARSGGGGGSGATAPATAAAAAAARVDSGKSASASSAAAPVSINTPRPLSLGYTGPHLASRPSLGSVTPRQALEARGRTVFNDADARMAAWDAMDVAVALADDYDDDGSNGSGDAISSSSSAAGPAPWEPPRLQSFNALKAPHHLLARMKRARLNRPTPIQSAAIPLLSAGRDALIAAPPGSGATAAYLIPLLACLERLQRPRSGWRAYPPAAVLAPGRELAHQVAAEAQRLCEGGKLKVVAVTGGADIASQRSLLRGGADLVVATPGRMLDLAARGTVRLSHLRWLVLEEAEALLAPGLDAAVRELLLLHLAPGGATAARGALLLPANGGKNGSNGSSSSSSTDGRVPLQTVIVASSAADVTGLRAAAADLLRPGAVIVSGAMPGGPAASPAAPGAAQRVVRVDRALKERALLSLLTDGCGGGGGGGGTLVCCASAAAADRVHAVLSDAGVAAGVLHARRSQAQRDEALQCFRFGVTRALVACKASARGLDLPDVARLVNFDPPDDEVDYAKRLARLGRGAPAAAAVAAGGGAGAGSGGAMPPCATTLVCAEDDAPRAGALVRALRAAGAAAPKWLVQMAEAHAARRHLGSSSGSSALDGVAEEGDHDSSSSGSPHSGGRRFSLRPNSPAAIAGLGAYIDRQPSADAAARHDAGAAASL